MPSTKHIIPARTKPPTCAGCPLSSLGSGFATFEGTGYNGVVALGAYLGKHEVEAGMPLQPSGAAGAVFERTLARLGMSRSSFRIVNVINCMPPDNKFEGMPWEWPSLEHCKAHWEQMVLDMPQSGPGYKQKVILAMGELATRTLTGLQGKFDALRGFPIETPYGLVLPTYNPAKLIAGRDSQLVGVFRKDLERAVELARDGWIKPKVNYITHPTVQELQEFHDRAASAPEGVFLTFDIENNYAGEKDLPQDGINWINENAIKSVQFSLAKNEAVFVPWTDEFIPLIRKILALPIEKWSHNGWNHDAPILRDHHAPVAEPHYDHLWLFHHVEPDLTTEDTDEGSGISSRLGLQYSASLAGYWQRWKHMSKLDPHYYGCVDVDVLQWTVPYFRAQAQREGLWESYLRYVYEYHFVLDDVMRRGIPVDEARRQQVRAEMQSKLDVAESEIQRAYPHELKNIHPENGFVREPKWDGESYRKQSDTSAEWLDSDSNQWLPMERRQFTGLSIKSSQECDCFALQTEGKNGKPLKKPRKVWPKDCPKCQGKKKIASVATDAERWVCVLPFKPSKDQIIKYMLHVKHTPPKKRGGGGKLTTEFKELEALARKHPGPDGELYTKIVAKRKLEKMIATYIDGWKPDADGRVHSQILMATATGQLSAKSPNCFSADTELLTNRGWVLFPELTPFDKVAQYDRETEAIDFVFPLGYVKNKHSGSLASITTREQLDILATNDHNCWLKNRKTGKWISVPAEAYPEDYIQPQAGIYVGGSVSWSWAQVCLRAALQADAYVVKKEQAIQWVLYKPRKINRLRQALIESGIPFTEHPKKTKKDATHKLDGVRFRIARRHVPEFLKKKEFGSELLDLDRNSMNMLADEVWHWDGDFVKKSAFYSKEKNNVDWVQIVQILSGRRSAANKYTIWHAQTSLSSYSLTTNRRIEDIPYEGYVYCVTMPKGTIIVRRNGKVAITGNCLNPPRPENVLAEAFNSMIVAPPGHVFVAFDYKSYHGATLAALSGDEVYYKVAVQAGDAHSFLTGHFMGMPVDINLPLDEMKRQLKAVKEKYAKERSQKYKSMNLGYGFGMQGPGMAERYPESFTISPTQVSQSCFRRKKPHLVVSCEDCSKQERTRQARAVVAWLDAQYAKNTAWRQQRAGQAARDEKIISTCGFVRRFYSVYEWRKELNDQGETEWKRRPGKDAESVYAFEPANHAHVNFREVHMRLNARGLLEKYNLILPFHDACWMLPRVEDLHDCVRDVAEEMRRPIKLLAHPVLCPDGLVVDVDAKSGVSWADMKELDIKEILNGK